MRAHMREIAEKDSKPALLPAGLAGTARLIYSESL
jgi:hypothetical protein